MTFTSPEFIVFLVIVFYLYWRLRLKGQNILLVAASYFFYGWWDWRFLSLMFISTLVDYFGGLAIHGTDNPGRRKAFLTLALTSNLSILGFFKYYNFFVSSLQHSLASLGFHALSLHTLTIILPIGISFYTFQTMSYSIDVYRRALKPTRSIVDFMAYVSFFPQLVAGPIERATNLLPQFQQQRAFNYASAADGLRLIAWGFFKKLVLADNLALVVEKTYGAIPQYGAWEILVATLFFSFQIYYDFSAYSDIATGTAQLFGFRLMRNFNYPYFSTNIIQFWKRWHISLSTWFRDYVYIPLGGNRRGTLIYARNILIVFLISGLWHGANWTFIAWGLIHGISFLPFALVKDTREYREAKEAQPSLKDIHKITATFLFVLLTWIFFRSQTITEAFSIITRIFSKEMLIFPGISTLYPKRLASVALVLAVEWWQKNKSHALMITHLPVGMRFCIYYLLILAIILLGVLTSYAPFIYFQF